jgi:hypothetical protein
MKERKSSSGRQQGDMGRQNQRQQSQQSGRNESQNKSAGKTGKQDKSH